MSLATTVKQMLSHTQPTEVEFMGSLPKKLRYLFGALLLGATLTAALLPTLKSPQITHSSEQSIDMQSIMATQEAQSIDRPSEKIPGQATISIPAPSHSRAIVRHREKPVLATIKELIEPLNLDVSEAIHTQISQSYAEAPTSLLAFGGKFLKSEPIPEKSTGRPKNIVTLTIPFGGETDGNSASDDDEVRVTLFN